MEHLARKLITASAEIKCPSHGKSEIHLNSGKSLHKSARGNSTYETETGKNTNCRIH